MTRPITYDGNLRREMTDDEYDAYQLLQAEVAAQASAQAAAADAKATALASARRKLAALGLTDAEVAALVGG
jgi:hypothetical protein